MLYKFESTQTVVVDSMTNETSKVAIKVENITIDDKGFSMRLCYCTPHRIISYQDHNLSPDAFNAIAGAGSYDNIIAWSKQALLQKIEETHMYGLGPSDFVEV